MALRIDTPAFARDPYPAYATLRSAGQPVYDESLGLWLVARHADVVACLADRRFGRALDATAGVLPPARWPDLDAITRYVTPNLLEREGPDRGSPCR